MEDAIGTEWDASLGCQKISKYLLKTGEFGVG